MKNRVMVYLAAIFAFILMVIGICLEQYTEENSRHISVRYENGVIAASELETYYEKYREKIEKGTLEKENQVPDITLWKKSEEQQVSNIFGNHVSTAEVIEAWGDIHEIYPHKKINGTFPVKNDTAGCAVSSNLAWKLFGSENVEGMALEYNDTSYIVRGVFQESKNVFVFQNKAQEEFSFLELSYASGPPAGSETKKFLQSELSLSNPKVFLEGSILRGFARAVLFLPYWVLVIYLLTKCRRLIKSEQIEWKRYVKSGLFFIAVIAAAAVFIRVGIRVTDDFLPSAWSNLSFWPEKWKELKEVMREMQEFIPIHRDKQMLFYVKVSVLCVIGSTAALFTIICMVEKENANKKQE